MRQGPKELKVPKGAQDFLVLLEAQVPKGYLGDLDQLDHKAVLELMETQDFLARFLDLPVFKGHLVFPVILDHPDFQAQ